MSERRKRSDASRPTLRDVALRAGVSTATVSRAMSAPATVSAALRERIRSATQALAFVPDQAARSLSSRRSRLIGVVAPTLADPGWAIGIAGMEARLAASGYSTLLALTGGGGRREEAAVAAMASRAVEAVIAVGQAPGDAARAQLHARGIPVEEFDGGDDAAGGDAGGGWRRAGQALGQYLIGLGHERCAWVAGEGAAMRRAVAVRAGLAAALAAAGLPPPADVFCGPGSPVLGAPRDSSAAPSIGRSGLPSRFAPRDSPSGPTVVLMQAATRATALICADDELALAVLRELAAAGVDVPRDVSVTGCGDTPAARHAAPPLTTLRRPYEAAGAAAAGRVLAVLRGDPLPPDMHLAKVVVRRSVGPAGWRPPTAAAAPRFT